MAAPRPALPHLCKLTTGCGLGETVVVGLSEGMDIYGAENSYGGGHNVKERVTDSGLLGSRIRQITDGHLPFADHSFGRLPFPTLDRNRWTQKTRIPMSVASADAATRFAFGENWKRYLTVLDDDRICIAEQDLLSKFPDIAGKRFLDAGCGSGLFSLAAHRLGARVTSFDFDPQSVSCAQELKSKYASESDWRIEQGSVLDRAYLASLGQFDIVYSWGVLHHTGNMWEAMSAITVPVAKGGRLMISIYNDQGTPSQYWAKLKAFHAHSGIVGKRSAELLTLVITWLARVPFDVMTGQPLRAYKRWREYKQQRGMSAWHDVVDWAGGYPFEVAKPEQVFSFFNERGFRLTAMKTCGGALGCNDFIFRRES